MPNQDAITRLTNKVLRRHILGALELNEATPQARAKLVTFIASQVPSMDDASIAYGAYATVSLDDRELKPLVDALWAAYRIRLLKWFGHAIQMRARQGGGGTGLKRLKEGIAAFIEDLPALLVKGYKPLSGYIQGNISEVIEAVKLDAVSAKVYRVLSDASRSAGFLTRTARATLPVEWDSAHRIWFIPPSPATFQYKDDLSRSGFRWDHATRRWFSPTLTPAMKKLVQVQEAPEPEVPQGTVAEMSAWFFGAWLPANIQRFDKVFNTFLRSKETSYTFKFKLTGHKVEVDIDRELAGPRDAVEELRYRYLGRQGRKPWLEVLDRYIDLTKTTGTSQVILLIDRMNNLQHSNGLFLEHFPSKVTAWYAKFLDRKYSARSAWVLAAFIGDSDLREMIQWYSPASGMHGQPQGDPDIPIEQKNLPQDVNWREKGYPRERGFKQPSRFDTEVQQNLSALPSTWDQKQAGGRRDLKSPSTVTVLCNREGAEAVQHIVEFLKWCGDVGHSCSLKDTDSSGKDPRVGGFDGDGNAYIQSITLTEGDD